MLVRQIGEFGLLDRIAAMLPQTVCRGDQRDRRRCGGARYLWGREYLLATCDIQVEGVHFMRDVIAPYQLGRRVAAINVSDIAAMGGDPRWALVSLAIPGDMEVGIRRRVVSRNAGTSGAGGSLDCRGQFEPDEFYRCAGFYTPGACRAEPARAEEHGRRSETPFSLRAPRASPGRVSN